MSTLFNKDLLSVRNLSQSDVVGLLAHADGYKSLLSNDSTSKTLEGYTICCAFYSMSTRTELSFRTAMNALGGRVIAFTDTEPLPGRRRPVEAARDVARVLGSYADAIVLRHPSTAVGRDFAEFATCPVISGGIGTGSSSEHPTQALTDLFTIQRRFGRLSDLSILLLGELNQRATRSLVLGLSLFGGNRLFFCHPDEGGLAPEDILTVEGDGCVVHTVKDYREIIDLVDIVYHNGIDPNVHRSDGELFLFERKDAMRLRAGSVVLHPLPRSRMDISFEVDDLPSAAYFEQAANGVPVRMAVLAETLQRDVKQHSLLVNRSTASN